MNITVWVRHYTTRYFPYHDFQPNDALSDETLELTDGKHTYWLESMVFSVYRSSLSIILRAERRSARINNLPVCFHNLCYLLLGIPVG